MKFLKYIIPVFALALVATSTFAQTKADAIEAYNAGLESANANNYEEAISHLTQAYTVASQLGAEGEDIVNRTSQRIPLMYQRIAAGEYNAFRQSKSLDDLNAAIEAFMQTAEAAEEYDQAATKQKAEGIVTQLYYTKSIVLYNEGELEAASTEVDKAINANANYAKAYYHKAKIHKKINDTNEDGIIDQDIEGLMRWYDQAIRVGEQVGDNELVRTATDAAHDELLAVGVKAMEGKNNQRAVDMLTMALNYNAESASVHYRLAEVYNRQSKPAPAIDHAQKALEFETGGRTDKAKIYFELGLANQTQNNKSAACDAFSNALYGNFKSPAEHKMEFELKCDATSPQE